MYKVLLVDTDPDTVGILQEAFEKVHIARFVINETAIHNAMEVMSDDTPDLIMISADNQADEALGLMQEVRLSQHLKCLSVIFLLPETTEIALKEKAFDAGADLLIRKPLLIPELATAIRTVFKKTEPEMPEQKSAGNHACESDFRSFFEHAADAIFIADIETHCIVDANQAAAKLMKMPVEQLIGMNQQSLHPEEESSQSLESFIQTAEVESQQLLSPLVQHNIRRSDGSLIPVEIHASLV